MLLLTTERVTAIDLVALTVAVVVDVVSSLDQSPHVWLEDTAATTVDDEDCTGTTALEDVFTTDVVTAEVELGCQSCQV